MCDDDARQELAPASRASHGHQTSRYRFAPFCSVASNFRDQFAVSAGVFETLCRSIVFVWLNFIVADHSQQTHFSVDALGARQGVCLRSVPPEILPEKEGNIHKSGGTVTLLLHAMGMTVPDYNLLY